MSLAVHCREFISLQVLHYSAMELTISGAVKLQKEGEKAKKERKKERKREKKESWGDREKTEAKKHSHRKRHHEELSQPTHKTGDLIKTREDESEQLEKSSLTEEQGGPAAVQSLYDSSDSTQNSSNRIKHTFVGVRPTTTQGNGNGLRIRLPLLRHRETESPISSERPSFSGRTEPVPAQQVKAAVRRHDPPSSAELPWFSGRHETVPFQPEPKATLHHRALPSSAGRPCFSGSTGTTPSEEVHRNTDAKPVSIEAVRPVGIGGCGSSRRSNDRDMRRLYKKLMVEWNPPSLQAENPEEDDQDWLFGKSSEGQLLGQQGETRGEQAASENEGSGSAPCSFPPRACFLPEVGIHALPYVVPF